MKLRRPWRSCAHWDDSIRLNACIWQQGGENIGHGCKQLLWNTFLLLSCFPSGLQHVFNSNIHLLRSPMKISGSRITRGLLTSALVSFDVLLNLHFKCTAAFMSFGLHYPSVLGYCNVSLQIWCKWQGHAVEKEKERLPWPRSQQGECVLFPGTTRLGFQ